MHHLGNRKRLVVLLTILGSAMACVTVTGMVRSLTAPQDRFSTTARMGIDKDARWLLVETRSDSGVFNGLNWLSVFDTNAGSSNNAATTTSLPNQSVQGITTDHSASASWYVLSTKSGEKRIQKWRWQPAIFNPLATTSDKLLSPWFSHGGQFLQMGHACDLASDADGRLFISFPGDGAFWVAELKEWSSFWAVDVNTLNEIATTQDGLQWVPSGCPRIHHDMVSEDLYVGWHAERSGSTLGNRAAQRIDGDNLAGNNWVTELWLPDSEEDFEDVDIAVHQGVVAMTSKSLFPSGASTHLYDTNVASLAPFRVGQAHNTPTDMAIDPYALNVGLLWILHGQNQHWLTGHLEAYRVVKD